MLLFIEGYPYSLDNTVRDGLTVRNILKDVVSVPVKEDSYAFGYVGYCYSKTAKDVVFFLPKVVLTGEQNEENGDDTIFGASPQEIIDFESDKVKSKFTEDGCKEYKEFLSTLSIWIYRTISVYKQTHNDNILESKEYQTESRGRKQKHNTLLDVIIALRHLSQRMCIPVITESTGTRLSLHLKPLSKMVHLPMSSLSTERRLSILTRNCLSSTFQY